jgi:hypothetical protein
MLGRGFALLGAEYRPSHPWLTFSISKIASRTVGCFERAERRGVPTGWHRSYEIGRRLMRISRS